MVDAHIVSPSPLVPIRVRRSRKGENMSDVINSIFGRAQNETPSSEGYGYGDAAPATVDAADTATVAPAETEDAVDETAGVDEAGATGEAEGDTTDDTSGEAVTDSVDSVDEAVESEESGEDTGTADEAVTEETEAAEEVPVVVATETETAEEAGSRAAAGARGSTTV